WSKGNYDSLKLSLYWGIGAYVIFGIGLAAGYWYYIIKPAKGVTQAEQPKATVTHEPLRGLLRPSSDPTPKDLCGGIKEGWIAVTFGSATMTTPKPYQCLLKFDDDEVLWFEKTSDGMYVNAIIQNEKGEEVA